MVSVPVYTLKKSNHSELQSILYRYQHFNVTDLDVRRCLHKIKETIGFYDSLETCLNDYMIIAIGEDEEAYLTYPEENWGKAVESIRKSNKFEDTILKINVGVQVEDSKIIPTEETKQILKSIVPQEALVCLIANENVRTLYACFALYEQSSLRSSIYTTCDIHSIMVKRKIDNIKDKFGKYCTLIEGVRSAVEHYNDNFYIKFREFTPERLGGIACGLHLSGAGPRGDSYHVIFYPTLKDFRKKLIDGILDEMKNRLAEDLISEIKSRIKSTLDNSFRNVSFKLTSIFPQLFSFIPNIVISVLFVVFGIVKDAVLAVVYTVWGVLIPIDVNDNDWRKDIATEVHKELSSHDGEIITKVNEKLDHLLSQFQDEINKLKETKDKLNELKIVDDTSQPTTHDQFLDWRESKQKAKEIEKIIKKFDDQSFVFFGKKNGKKAMSVRYSKCKHEIIKTLKKRFPDVDVKSIREATAESFIIEKHIEKKKLYQNLERVSEIQQVINYTDEELFRKHSNLNMMSISPAKGVRFTSDDNWTPREQMCIVIFCSCKGVIPFGEDQFPSRLCGYPVDVREGYMFGCCSQEFNKELRLGCSIGRQNRPEAGTIGLFVHMRNHSLEKGFVTARHVLFQSDADERDVIVVQPADEDAKKYNQQLPSINRQCGKVTRVAKTIDTVYVQIIDRAPINNSFPLKKEGGQGAQIDILGQLEPLGGMVKNKLVKFGRTTGLTTMVCGERPIGITQISGRIFRYPGHKAEDGIIERPIKPVIEIPIIDELGNWFFSSGDSGSAVLSHQEGTVSGYKVLGMAIGSFIQDTHERPRICDKCYVIPIENILEELDLELSHVRKPMKFNKKHIYVNA